MDNQPNSKITVIQNAELAIAVLFSVGVWMQRAGLKVSKWWKPENLNKEFLLQYAQPEEFYVAFMHSKPAAAMVLQTSEESQDWSRIDKGAKKTALYIHWLGVGEEFRGKGLPQHMVDFAEKLAIHKGISLLRVDTDAQETKLKQIYESMGFSLQAEIQEEYRKTAFYQKKV